MASIANIVATYELTPDDRSLLVMPLFHVHGLMAGAYGLQSYAPARAIDPVFAAGQAPEIPVPRLGSSREKHVAQ